ncbi:hypothetical protein [Desulfurobacterium crinifex]
MFKIDRNFTYREMHKELLSGSPKNACTYEEGLKTMNVIKQLQGEIDV